MTTDRLPWLLLMIALAALAWTAKGASEWKAVADVHASEAASHELRADSLSAVVAPIRQRADSLDSTLADSSAVWAARARENAVTVARLTGRANDARQTLEASLDSVSGALLAEYTQATDSIIEAQAAQITDLESERALLWARMETSDELVAGLTDENEALRDENAALRSAVESLRRGLNASSRQNTLLKAGGALLVAKVAYDFIQGSN